MGIKGPKVRRTKDGSDDDDWTWEYALNRCDIVGLLYDWSFIPCEIDRRHSACKMTTSNTYCVSVIWMQL